MAGSGQIGHLRAVITADTGAYDAALRKSADASKKFGQSVNDVGKTTERVTRQMKRYEDTFKGDRLLYSANNLTKVITNLGGATKLTAAEQAKVNRQLSEAIDKYRVLGQVAPKAMLDLEKATRQVGQATTQVATPLSNVLSLVKQLGPAIGVSLSVGAVTAFVKSIGTFAGKMVDLQAQTKISTDRLQAFNFLGAGVGLTIDDIVASADQLARRVGSGDDSAVGALTRLGIKASEFTQLSLDDALLLIDQRMVGVTNQFERASILTDLFGRSGARMGRLMDGTLRQLIEDTEKSGAVIDKALIQKADQFDDAWTQAWLRFRAGAVTAVGAAASAIEQLIALERGLSPGGGTLLSELNRQQLEEAAKRESVPDLPRAPGLPTLPAIGGGVQGPTPAEIAQVIRSSDATAKAAAATEKWNEARAKEREAIEASTQGMAYWLAGMKPIPPAIRSLDDSLTSGFLPAVQMSTDAVMAFATQGQDSILAFVKTLKSQDLTAVEQRLLTFWEIEFPETVERSVDLMTRSFSTGLTDMLVGLQGFKDGFTDIWRSIRAAFSDILASMLNQFISGFLRQMLAAMAGGSLAGTALGGALGIGTAAAGGAATGASVAAAGGTAAAAGAGTAAAGGGMGATIAAFATNPFTIAAAGGLALGLGIWKKGWFRGGEEGAQVNPARDAYLRQFGGFNALAALLTSTTGEPGGGRLFARLRSADTMSEFNAATGAINRLLQARGVAIPNAGIVAPGYRGLTSPLSGMAAASNVIASAPMAASSVAARTGAGGTPITMNLTIQAWDRADMADAFRTEIIPRFKDALQINQAGLRTAIAGVE